MKERFEGEAGRLALQEAILGNTVVGGNSELAAELVAAGELVGNGPGEVLVEQGATDSGVYLIVAGSYDVSINGRRVALRTARDIIGEMDAVEPSQCRAATVTAVDHAASLRVRYHDFIALADRHPQLWRMLAKTLSRKLDERNQQVGKARERSSVFVISSKEGLKVARAVQNAFRSDDFGVTVWTDGVFQASDFTLESLESQLGKCDFAVAIAQPDDEVIARGTSEQAPRDNVIFEFGLCVGRLGRSRALLLIPQGHKVRLPSDLTGITTIPYRVYPDGELASGIAPACNEVRELIQKLGPRL